MLVDPAAAVIVPPPQLPFRPVGVATTCPAGIGSEKPMPLSDCPVFGFERLKVSVVLPFRATLPAPYVFWIVGGSSVGGVIALPDEPPPHATLPSRVAVRTSSNDRKCGAAGMEQVVRGLLEMSPLSLICYRDQAPCVSWLVEFSGRHLIS